MLSGLARTYLAPIAPTNGQVAGFLRTEIAPDLVAGQRVLYLGDFDLSGDQIEANTCRVLESLVGPLDWRRTAITAKQIDVYDLPAFRRPTGATRAAACTTPSRRYSHARAGAERSRPTRARKARNRHLKCP